MKFTKKQTFENNTEVTPVYIASSLHPHSISTVVILNTLTVR